MSDDRSQSDRPAEAPPTLEKDGFRSDGGAGLTPRAASREPLEVDVLVDVEVDVESSDSGFAEAQAPSASGPGSSDGAPPSPSPSPMTPRRAVLIGQDSMVPPAEGSARPEGSGGSAEATGNDTTAVARSAGGAASLADGRQLHSSAYRHQHRDPETVEPQATQGPTPQDGEEAKVSAGSLGLGRDSAETPVPPASQPLQAAPPIPYSDLPGPRSSHPPVGSDLSAGSTPRVPSVPSRQSGSTPPGDGLGAAASPPLGSSFPPGPPRNPAPVDLGASPAMDPAVVRPPLGSSFPPGPPRNPAPVDLSASSAGSSVGAGFTGAGTAGARPESEGASVSPSADANPSVQAPLAPPDETATLRPPLRKSSPPPSTGEPMAPSVPGEFFAREASPAFDKEPSALLPDEHEVRLSETDLEISVTTDVSTEAGEEPANPSAPAESGVMSQPPPLSRAPTPPSNQAGSTPMEGPESRKPPPPRRSGKPSLPATKIRRRPWWETLFGDDFARAHRSPTTQQLQQEVDFILGGLELGAGKVVLDLGCGQGEHAVELSRRGLSVVGYDLSVFQLAMAGDRAQAEGQKINFLQGDMREMAFDAMFDGVLCWDTSFGYFEEDKNQDVARRVHAALKPGGSLLLMVLNRDFAAREAPTNIWFEGDGCVCMDDVDFDWITSRLRVKRSLILDDGRSKELHYSMRLYNLSEIGKLLHGVGFRVVEVSGNLTTPGAFFGPVSPYIIIRAQRP